MNLLLPSNLEQQAPHKQFLWLLVVVLACISIVTTILMALLLAMGISPDEMDTIDIKNLNYGQLQGYKFLQMLSTVGLFLLPAMAYSYLQSGSLRYLQLQKNILPIGVLMALLVLFSGLPIVDFLANLNEQMQLPKALSGLENWMRQSEDDAQEMIGTFLKMDTLFDLLVNIVMIALLPALAEEALFRGSLQPTLQRWFNNPHLAIWTTAFTFSFIHLQFYGFLPRMALGVILGYIFLFSRNLWYPILTHFIYNGMQVVVAYFFFDEIESAIQSNDPSQHLSIFWVILSTPIFLTSMLFLRQISPKTEVENNKALTEINK